MQNEMEEKWMTSPRTCTRAVPEGSIEKSKLRM